MDDCWSLNDYRVLNVRNWAVNNEVVDIIVGVDIRHVLAGRRRIIVNFSFLFWRLLLVNYIFYFQIIVQLKVLIVVPARTLIIKIDCIRFWSFSIRLEMFSF
jgi:hypothetical protein